MRKLWMILFAVIGVLMLGMTAFAQEPFKTAAEAAANNPDVLKFGKIAAGFGFAIAAGLGALGQSRIAASAVEGAARNPGAAGRIQIMMIIGLALIESLVLFALVIVFAKV
ncbi:MAG TPA: ATP synthase F0 subunit C [Pyrinomonadaceae bacterium]|nr:ATP synthase F0 subunit C [Pyrinomonadaceae bacterium]